MARPLPPRERKALERSALEGWANGEPVARIAARLRVAPATIYRWLRAAPGLGCRRLRLSTCPTCGGPVREPAP